MPRKQLLTEEEKKERVRQRSRDYRKRMMAEDKEARMKQERAWRQKWHKEHPEYAKHLQEVARLDKHKREQNREFSQKHRDKDPDAYRDEIREYMKEYRATEKGRAAVNRASRRNWRKRHLSPEERAILDRDKVRKAEIMQELADIKRRDRQFLGD